MKGGKENIRKEQRKRGKYKAVAAASEEEATGPQW
jgi:hypothetical protein